MSDARSLAAALTARLPVAVPAGFEAFCRCDVWLPAAEVVFFLVAFAHVCQLLQTLQGLPFSSSTIPGGSFCLVGVFDTAFRDSAVAFILGEV